MVVDSIVYIKKIKNLYFDTFILIVSSVEQSDPGNFLKDSICNFQVAKICKKRAHGNDKKKLPSVF